MEKEKTSPFKVILYPRVSSSHQAKSGDSIDAQVRRLKEFCLDKGYEIVDIYTDAGKSASVSSDKLDIKILNNKFIVGIDLNKRPAFKRILDEVNSGKFEGIVFLMWDRFSRDNVFSKISKEYFLRHNIRLIPSDDTDEPLFADIKSSFNEEEIRKMKEKVRGVRIDQFEKGIITGRCPLGYKPIFKNKRDRRGIIGIVPDSKKVDMIRDVFFMTSQGKKYKEICDKHKLKPQSYYNIIKNKVYIGIITFEGKENKGVHKPIIDEETFYKVNPNIKKDEEIDSEVENA